MYFSFIMHYFVYSFLCFSLYTQTFALTLRFAASLQLFRVCAALFVVIFVPKPQPKKKKPVRKVANMLPKLRKHVAKPN